MVGFYGSMVRWFSRILRRTSWPVAISKA